MFNVCPPFFSPRPFHRPVISARAQHVHHIIGQESILNISEHHNPRPGTGGKAQRGGFTGHMAEPKRRTEIERQASEKKQRTREALRGEKNKTPPKNPLISSRGAKFC